MLKNYKVKYALPFIWLGSSSILTLVTLWLLASSAIFVRHPISSNKYSIFSSAPLVLGAETTSIGSADSRTATLDNVFKSYGCPISGMGKVFVEEADKNNIPYWLVPSISFQESTCGKQTPVVDGKETYNAYGWGVWGENIKKFDSWEDGIRIVSKYMSEKFLSQGVVEPCEIMKTYTPPSNGSWCNGVKYFTDIITGFKSPLDQ